VVFQNTIKSKQDQLVAALGPAKAAQLSGFNAGANVAVIKALPPAQREIARAIFASSIHNLWIMYVSVAALGILSSLLITRQKLTREHETTKTGMAVEKEKRAEREERRKSRKSIGSPMSPLSPTSPTFPGETRSPVANEKEEV
jgi:hypothetical protein